MPDVGLIEITLISAHVERWRAGLGTLAGAVVTAPGLVRALETPGDRTSKKIRRRFIRLIRQPITSPFEKRPIRAAILALSRWQIAAADAQAGQFALIRPRPPVQIPRHFRAVYAGTGGVLSRSHFTLAAQFCEAGGNRREIIGSAGSAHVSSGSSACRPQATGLLKGERMLAPMRAIKQAEITGRTWEGLRQVRLASRPCGSICGSTQKLF